MTEDTKELMMELGEGNPGAINVMVRLHAAWGERPIELLKRQGISGNNFGCSTKMFVENRLRPHSTPSRMIVPSKKSALRVAARCSKKRHQKNSSHKTQVASVQIF